MVNFNKLETEKKDILKNLNPMEMEFYLRNLISNLYESFINNDTEKALTSKECIEEATDIFKKEGYYNTLSKELSLRLSKANEVLINTLIEKDKLDSYIVEEILSNHIVTVINANTVLESLITSYNTTPSKALATAIKDVAEIESTNLLGVKYLLESDVPEDNPYYEEIEILKDYYSSFENKVVKINSFN